MTATETRLANADARLTARVQRWIDGGGISAYQYRTLLDLNRYVAKGYGIDATDLLDGKVDQAKTYSSR